ncbi:MAG: ABC transporter ATP-binding protein [Ferroplasma sp.]
MIILNRYFIRLIHEILHYRRNSSIIISSIIVSSIIAMIGPYLIGIATDSILALQFTALIFIAGTYIVIYILNYWAQNRRTKYMITTSQTVIKNLRNNAFRNLQYVPLSYYSDKSSGQIISRITNDAETLSDFLTFQLPQVLAGIAGIIASIFIMLYLDPVLTLYAIIIIPMLLGTIFLMNKRIKFNYLNVRKRIAELTGNVGESVNGIKAIKNTGSEIPFVESFDGVNQNNYEANVKAVRLTSIFSSIVQSIEGLGIIIVLYEGGSQVLHGILSIGLLVSFIVYVQSFFNPIVQLSQFYNSYQSSSIAIERIYRIIDEKNDENKHEIENPVFNDAISFNNVNFSYGKREVIKNVSFTIEKGKKIAIIGKTGAGKTTISNMMLKFIRPNSGTITLDGIDINNIDTRNYRKLYSVILQEPFLFEGTVLENIRFSDAGLELAKINDYIQKLGLGSIMKNIDLNSQVGERGTNLSEGQRQAISILRAAINDPEIIIMDEATSELDSKNEDSIQKALINYMEGKTVITIAHHINTILKADTVLYIDNGKIIEKGNPEELIKQKGYFYEAYRKSQILL